MKKLLLLFLTILSLNMTYSQTSCADVSPICGEGILPTPSITGTPSVGSPGCLGSAPNPNWYLIKFNESSPNAAVFDLHQGNNPPNYNNTDIDFICWGPFTQAQIQSGAACNNLYDFPSTAIPNNIVDCSYSASAVEQITISNINTPNSYYILLITNFSGQAGNFVLTPVSTNPAVMPQPDCAVVCGVDIGPTATSIYPSPPAINTVNNCMGTTNSQILHCNFQNPPANQATLAYQWYLDTGSGFQLQPGFTTKSITVTVSGTWKVVVTHPDCTGPSEDSVIINFGTLPTVNTPPTQVAPPGCNPIFNLNALIPAMVSPSSPSSVSVKFYTDEFFFDEITNPGSFTTNNDMTIYVLVENLCGTVDTSFGLDVTCTPFATGNTICAGNNGQLSFAGGTAGTVITFTEGPNTYNVTLGASGTAVWTTPLPLLSTTTYTLTNAASGSPVVNTPLNSTATITVLPQPVATSFTGTTAICNGSSTNLVFAGTPNATITYSDGTSTFTTPLDNTGNSVVSVTPIVTTTYSLVGITTTGTQVCSNPAVGTVIITVNNPPIAGTDGITTVCETSTAAIDLFSLITGEQAGGAWTRTGGTGGTFNALAGTFTPAVGSTSSTFEYTLTGTFPCPNDVSQATVTINAQPVAGADGSTLVCETSAAAIDLFSLITGEQTGGTWARTGGTGGTFDAVAGTFTPAVGVSGLNTFEYTLVGVAPCVNDSSIATVNVNPQPVAGTDGNTTVCETSSTAIDLFSLISGEQTGGVWTRTSGIGGTFNAAAGTFTPAVGASAINTFEYTLTGTAPCVNDLSVATININPQPTAGTDGAPVTVCETSSTAIDLFSLITGEQAGGTWTRTGGTGGTFDAVAGTFTPAVGATNSTFTYTLTGALPCVDDTSLATININPQPTAGTDGAISVCETSSTVIDLFSLITGEQAGGVWTRTGGSGGVFNAAAGTFTPAVGASAINAFTYTLTGTAPCINDSSVATVNINPQPAAGTDGNTTICDNNVTPINLFGLITGEQAGGTWTQTSGTGGTFDPVTGTFTPALGATTSTFTYTLVGAAPCVNDSSIATVNINPIPTNISISGGTGTCAGVPVNLTITATPGTTITWTGSPSTITIGASGSNVIPVSPTATTTYSLVNATLNGCTIPATGSTTVTVSPTPQFVTQIPDETICDGEQLDIASQLTSTVPGTTYTWNASTNNVNLPLLSGDETNIDQIVDLVNNLEMGYITLAVRPKVGNCYGNEQQIFITIRPIPVIASVGTPQSILCNSNNNNIAEIDVDANPNGTTFTWQVNTATNVQIIGGATSGTSTTGNISLPLALIDPLVPGTISFDITPINGICTGATQTNAISFTVNPIPGTPIPLADDTICSGEPLVNFIITTSPSIAGTILEYEVIDSQNVSGATFGSGPEPLTIDDTLINTSDVQGYVVYRVKSSLGNCDGAYTDYTIYVDPLPKPDLADGHICVNATTGNTYQSYILDTHLNNPNYDYDWYVFNTATNQFDPIAGATGSTYEVTAPGEYKVVVTNLLTNCSGEDTATVIEVFPATGFTTTVTDAFTNNATITITVNPLGTGSLVYSLDGGAWQTSNVFTGVEAGSHDILITDLEGCTNMSDTITVIDYPKYFTPNGDGFNEYWNIVGLDVQHNAKIYIFDRYGKLIKQIDPLSATGWDGTFNGQQVPSTDYWFSVDYTENEQQKQFKAHFTLKR